MMRPNLGCAAALAVALFALPARADDTSRQKQSEALFQEGLTLHDGGRRAESLAAYEKAYGLWPTANTLYSIAREEQLLGRGVEALRHYREALKNPLLTEKWQHLARERIAELEPRFARVLVKGPAGVAVTVGGKALRLPSDEPVDLEPGAVAMKGERDGIEYAASGRAEAGKVTVLELKPTSAPVPPTDPPREEPSGAARNVTVVALLGAGIASAAVGVGFVVGSNRAANRLDALLANPASTQCPGPEPLCAELKDAAEARADNRNLARVFVPAGIGLALAAGVTYLLWKPASGAGSTSLAFAPIFDVSQGGFAAFGRF